jgi:FHA domain
MESQKPKVALTFAIYQGGSLVGRETIAQDIVKIGKDAKSHLRVDDAQAAVRHSIIEVGGIAEITLIDLGNEPGTIVNGQRVNKCKLAVGDQILIGGTTLVFENAELAAASTSLAPQSLPPQGNPFVASVAPSAPPAVNPFVAGDNPFVAAAAAPNPFVAPAAAPAFTAPAVPAPNPFAAAPSASPFASANPFESAGNPFVAQAEPAYGGYAGVNSPGGSDFDPSAPYTYQLVKSGPEVNSDEVEVRHLNTIEVSVLWDTNVLHTAHLTPPRSYFVGEPDPNPKSKELVDYQVPSEAIGVSRAPVVIERGGTAAVVFFAGCTGTVQIPGEGNVDIRTLIASGRTRQSQAAPGASEFDLPTGATARVFLPQGLGFQVSPGYAGKPIGGGVLSDFEPAPFLFTGLSFLLHLGLIASFAFFLPSMNGENVEDMDQDQILMMRKMLNAQAERELEEKKTEQQPDSNADNKEGGTGTRAKGEEGSMGNPNTASTGKKYGVQGPQDNPDPHIARQAALREAAEFGLVGLLNTGAGGDPNAPTAPWGREDSLGNDPMSARGNMWGDAIGDSFGAGGLGLSGLGEGGGGRGEGIGLGNVGGFGQGFGNGHGRLAGAHTASAPKIRQGATQVNGRLPAEVIQRIVRQNFGRFTLCYQNGLKTNPTLAGRVSVRFAIDRSGAVSTAGDGGSDLPDQGVVQCVVRGFNNLSFPQPEGGVVTVVYPIIFSPGD